MYIIRTLLSYSLLLLLVTALAAAWVYRDDLKPELDAAIGQLETRFGEVADQPQAAQDSRVGQAPTATAGEAAAVAETASPSAAAEPATAEAAFPPTEKAPLAEHAAAAEGADEAGATRVESETSAPAAPQADAPEAGPAPASIVALAEETSAESAPTAESAQPRLQAAETPDGTAASVEATLLDRARRAYWVGDLPAAVQAYQALLDRDPADPDVWGELGNVYYAQGRWSEAGEAYYEAARRLQARGDARQLGYLLRLIEGLAPEKAAKLRAAPVQTQPDPST